MQFEQLKLVGCLSGFFLLLGFGCWLLLQTATMDGAADGADFIGEFCTVAESEGSTSLTPCIACMTIPPQLISQPLTLGPVIYTLPAMSNATSSQ
ncbi:hypothetical protein [Methylobacillus sp.]|uniref:hypothetical protein n=1 Tax=Methylobacillus sp. TaxID=56818 RepID=UPI002FE0B101